MTNKEAKDVLQEQIDRYGQEYDAEGIEALNKAIEVLEQTRWIPLNAEGNEPKEEGFYLLCLSDGYVTNVYYDGKDWELWLNAGEPIAWQPLPLTDAEYSIIINALNKFSTQPPKTQQKVEQPCEDAISREEAIRVAEQGQIQGYEWQFKKLCNLQSVTPQPKIGHWIRWYERKENDGCIEHIPHCKCSECGKEYDPHSSQFVKYCNKCGAKMEVEE